MTKLVGLQKKENKEGKVSYSLYFTEPLEKGEGVRAFTEWTAKDCSRLVVGCDYDLMYSKGYQDKAYLSEIREA